jgi:hypothetical protein
MIIVEQTHSRTYIVQCGGSVLLSPGKDGQSMKLLLHAVHVLRSGVCEILYAHPLFALMVGMLAHKRTYPSYIPFLGE